MALESLARELVAFDARISEEVAEHLVARAERLNADPEQAGLAAIVRADRFRKLASLIQRELGLEPAPSGFGPTLAPLHAAGD